MDYVTSIPVYASGALCYAQLIDGQWHAVVECDDVFKCSEQLRSAVRATVRRAAALNHTRAEFVASERLGLSKNAG
jgi:hypothetical protein